MNVRIIIPIRDLREAKSRLSPALSAVLRESLARKMFQHVLTIAEGMAPTFVVSSDASVLRSVSNPIAETGSGLNEALEQAAGSLPDTFPVLALSADLPQLSAADLASMISLLDQADVVAAPDRSGLGTNALLLARPRLIRYCFGDNSFAAHRQAAINARLRFGVCSRLGLASDVDHPEDLIGLVDKRFQPQA